METSILLESGTNELEILEFKVGNQCFGINVAKVKEILPYKNPTMVPNAHGAIEGIYMPREEIITVINLFHCLGIMNANASSDMLIVTNFNKLNVGFHVNSVQGIHRISWEKITKPDATIGGNGDCVATGILKMDDRLVIILDFEKLVADV